MSRDRDKEVNVGVEMVTNKCCMYERGLGKISDCRGRKKNACRSEEGYKEVLS